MFLLDCASDIKSCCNDYGLANILYIIRSALDLIFIIVPIILIVALAISFFQLLSNPDDKKKKKSLLNKFIALLVVFFLPVLVNVVLVQVDVLQLGSCWSQAKVLHDEIKKRDSIYVSTTNKQNKSFIVGADKYEEGEPSASSFSDYEHLNIYNQTGQYANHAVCSNYSATVSANACGLSTYMAIRYALTGQDTDFLSFSQEACNTGLFNGIGTSWNIVQSNSLYSSKYGITSQGTSNNYDSYVSELQSGKVLSVLIQNGSRNIEQGGFNATSNGHFIALINYDSSKDKIYVYNPTGYNTGWKDKSAIERFVVNCATGVWAVSKN